MSAAVLVRLIAGPGPEIDVHVAGLQRVALAAADEPEIVAEDESGGGAVRSVDRDERDAAAHGERAGRRLDLNAGLVLRQLAADEFECAFREACDQSPLPVEGL